MENVTEENLPEPSLNPIEEMTLEEAQKRLTDMVSKRNALNESIAGYKSYIQKKIKAL